MNEQEYEVMLEKLCEEAEAAGGKVQVSEAVVQEIHRGRYGDVGIITSKGFFTTRKGWRIKLAESRGSGQHLRLKAPAGGKHDAFHGKDFRPHG